MGLARIGKGIRYLVVLNIVQIIATVLFYHIITGTLTRDEMGITATLTFVYTTLTALSSLALPLAGAKYIAEFLGRGQEERASAVARSVVRLVLLSSALIAVATQIAIYGVFGRSHLGEIIPFSLIGAASFLASLKLTYLAFIQGLQLFDKYSLVNLSTTIVSYLAGIFLTSYFGLTGFAAGILVGDMTGLVLVLAFYHGQLLKTPFFHSFQALFEFSIPVFIMQIVTIFSDWADRILFLATSLNLALLGVYDLSVKSSASVLVIARFFETITLPIFSTIYGRSGEKDVPLTLQKALRWLGFVYFPAAFGLAVVAEPVMTLFYGQAYAEGGLPLAMLSISSVFTAFGVLLGSALKSVGKTKAFIKISLASLLADAIIVMSFTPVLGVLSPAFARVVSSLLAFTLIYNELRRWIKITIDWDGLRKGLLASITPMIPLLLFNSLRLSSIAVNLSLGIGFGVLIYVLSLSLLRALRREDFHLIRQSMPMFTSIIDFVEKIMVTED